MVNETYTPSVGADELALIKIAAAAYGVQWQALAALCATEAGQSHAELARLLAQRLTEHPGNPLDLHYLPDDRPILAYGHHFITWFAARWTTSGRWPEAFRQWYHYFLDHSEVLREHTN